MDLITALTVLALAPIDWSPSAGAVWTAGGCILFVITTGLVVGMQR